MLLSVRLRLALLITVVLPLSGCLFRSHKATVLVSNAPLKSASAQELINIINTEASKIKTLNATVNIAASSGGSVKGKITDYQEVKGYILVRKPDMLRMIGLMPVVRNRAFDMVSNGSIFKLWVPAKNKFITGHNEVTQPSKQPLENLRPQHIYDALLLRAIDPHNEIAVLENGNETVQDPKTKKQVIQPDYVIDVIRRADHGWYLSRKITFSRVDLQPHRQVVYDNNGYIATDATYDNYRDYSGLTFPNVIHIWRPQQEYSVTLTIEKLNINQPITDEQFALNQPPGAQVVQLDNGGTSAKGDGPQSH